MKSNVLQARLVKFACLCIRISEKLPETLAGKNISGQLIRSATSPALHYGEAVAAESKKDFVHKMKVCLKELHESFNCLQLIREMQWNDSEKLNVAIMEANELISIFTASVKTAAENIANAVPTNPKSSKMR